MKERTLIRFAISAAVFLLFMIHTSGAGHFRLLETMENFSYDTLVRLTLPNEPDKRVIVVDLDEKSLAAEGWPWPRYKWATLVDNLFDKYHARVMGFDVQFTEPNVEQIEMLDRLAKEDLAGLPGAAEKLQELKQKLDYDRQFAEAVSRHNVVLGYSFKQSINVKGEAATAGAICAPLMNKQAASGYAVDFVKAVGFAGSVKVLADAAPACGFFDNPRVDTDGVFRRVPLLQIYDGAVYPSLALALTRGALGNAPVQMEFEPADRHTSLNLESVLVGASQSMRRAPVDGEVAVYVPYRGPAYVFKYISASDVLHGTVADPTVLNDAIIIVGSTAAGLQDMRVTPVSFNHPGVEVHANIVSGLLDGTIRQKAPYYSGIETILLLLIGLVMAWGFSRLSPLGSAGLGLSVMLVSALLAIAMWSGEYFIMPLGVPLAFTLIVMMAHLFYGFFIESRRARDISKMFGEYVPPEVVSEMADKGGQISMEGETREMTVMFSDVRGFTTVSEKLDAKELSELMNLFLTKQTGVIQKYRGTIDKYMGDAVMAFWGAPLPDEQHALHGVLAGMEMIAAVRELDEEFAKRGWPPLYIGVGLNTGKMSVGNMGSEFRRAYTVMGDAVNLGSRVEGQTKEYGVAIIVTENTRNLLPSDWAFRELDLIKVKGKNEPVAIYEPLGPKEQLDPDLRTDLARHRGANKLYRQQKWDEAEAEFFNLSQSGRPHKVYEVMIGRIMELREHPPGKDWDGAYVAKSK